MTTLAVDGTLTGIDVSRHQGTINWPAVASAGHAFAFLKATDGVRYAYVDWFHRNAPQAQAAGLTLGAYHFLLDHHSGEAQARYYVQEVSRFSPGFDGVVPIVDIEREADGTTPRLSHLRAFVEEFRRLVPGRAMVIYTGRWYWVGVLGNPYGADLGSLWHSEYDGITPIHFDVANGPELDTYGGWAKCLIWQHTSTGRCPGVAGNCDLNLFYSGPGVLAALAGRGHVQPPPPEEEDVKGIIVKPNDEDAHPEWRGAWLFCQGHYWSHVRTPLAAAILRITGQATAQPDGNPHPMATDAILQTWRLAPDTDDPRTLEDESLDFDVAEVNRLVAEIHALATAA